MLFVVCKAIARTVVAATALAILGCGGGGGGGGGSGSGAPPVDAPPSCLASSTAGALRLDRAESFSANADGTAVLYAGIPVSAQGLPANATQFQNIFLCDGTGPKLLVSVDPAGQSAGNGISQAARLSADGRVVVFTSRATNLVAGVAYPGAPASPNAQLFARDLASGTTRLLSANPALTSAANGDVADQFVISRNSRYVASASTATNLVPGITYAAGHNVFVRDLVSGTTELVSADPAGTSAGCCGALNDSQFPAISDDGRYVAFGSYATNLVGVTYTSSIFGIGNIFMRDRTAGTTRLISASPAGTAAANGHCTSQTFSDSSYLSGDGSVLAFSCRATNLVVGPTYLLNSSGVQDYNVFAWDRTSSSVTLVSRSADTLSAADEGASSAVLSADGKYVAFTSGATNLVAGVGYYVMPTVANTFRWDRNAGAMKLVTLSVDGTTGADFDTGFAQISDDGQVVAFGSTATNLSSTAVSLTFDDRQNNVSFWTGATDRVSLASVTTSGSAMGLVGPVPALSGNGRLVVFISPLDRSAYYFIR